MMALHGGLEANTWEIASEVADIVGASIYGVVQPPELTWHVPSRRYALDESSALEAFCSHVDIAISLHGYGGVRDHPQRWTTICVGGQGRSAATVVGAALRSSLSDYVVLDDLEHIPVQYRGVHPDNPVNRVRGTGVQVELPPRVRGTSPIWSEHPFDTHPWVPHTESLITALVEATGRLQD